MTDFSTLNALAWVDPFWVMQSVQVRLEMANKFDLNLAHICSGIWHEAEAIKIHLPLIFPVHVGKEMDANSARRIN